MVLLQLLLSVFFGPSATTARNRDPGSGPRANRVPVTDDSVSRDDRPEGAGILLRRLSPLRDGGEKNSGDGTITAHRATTANDNAAHEYRPRPGDTCRIRYDCYALSPILASPTRTGLYRVDTRQRRTRTWIDGNNNNSSSSSSSTITTESGQGLGDGSQPRSQPHSHPHPHPQTEPELPALSFVVGSGDVIRGLEVAVQRLKVGDRAEATIPHAYAYGYGYGSGCAGMGPGKIAASTDLVVVVHLLAVEPTPDNLRKAELELELELERQRDAKEKAATLAGNGRFAGRNWIGTASTLLVAALLVSVVVAIIAAAGGHRWDGNGSNSGINNGEWKLSLLRGLTRFRKRLEQSLEAAASQLLEEHDELL